MTRFLILLLALPLTTLAQREVKPRNIIVFGDPIAAGNALEKDQHGEIWVKQLEKASAGGLMLINEGEGTPDEFGEEV